MQLPPSPLFVSRLPLLTVRFGFGAHQDDKSKKANGDFTEGLPPEMTPGTDEFKRKQAEIKAKMNDPARLARRKAKQMELVVAGQINELRKNGFLDYGSKETEANLLEALKLVEQLTTPDKQISTTNTIQLDLGIYYFVNQLPERAIPYFERTLISALSNPFYHDRYNHVRITLDNLDQIYKKQGLPENQNPFTAAIAGWHTKAFDYERGAFPLMDKADVTLEDALAHLEEITKPEARSVLPSIDQFVQFVRAFKAAVSDEKKRLTGNEPRGQLPPGSDGK